MKDISTLVEDIYGLFNSDYIPLDKAVSEFGAALSKKISTRLSDERGRPTLRLSNLGSKCLRQLYYTINEPEKMEPLPPEARMKFLYGDILEELLLFLAKEAGHQVEGEQDALSLDGVLGHRDAIIDGMVVDVKSASSFSFKKFANHLKPDDDAFGYLTQLSSYVKASENDERVIYKGSGAFLAIDKTLGHIVLDIHNFGPVDFSKRIHTVRKAISSPVPPSRGYEPEPEGKSGNQKLGVNCSYCSFKNECYPRLRTFLYSYGPVFLTRVEREPNVPEITPS